MKTKNKFLLVALNAMMMFSCAKDKFITEPGNLVPKTADQDPKLPSIVINGAVLHSEAFGHPDSTMIVCVHGGPGRDYRYMLNYKELVNYGYRVVFYDQRGSGLSQRFPKSYYTSMGISAVDLMYDDLSGIIAHYKTHPGQKVILAGHSWGAMLATAYVSRHPNEIHGLAVGEPGGFKWDDVVEFYKKSRNFPKTSEILSDAVYMDQFITGKENQHEILDYKLGMAAVKNNILGEENESGTFWRLGAVINSTFMELGMKHKPDFSEGIHHFNTPVLFFYSEHNKAYPYAWATKISSAYNKVELCKVPGVGHYGIISNPTAWKQTTLPRLLSYLKSI